MFGTYNGSFRVGQNNFRNKIPLLFWDGCKEVEQIEDISANVACKLADWLCILKFWHFSWKFAHDCFWHSPIFLHYCIASALSRWVLFCCGRLPKPLWLDFWNFVQKLLEAFLPFWSAKIWFELGLIWIHKTFPKSTGFTDTDDKN